MKTNSLFITAAMIIVLAACKGEDQEMISDASGDEKFLIVTDEQFVAGKIAIGDPRRMVFEESIICNGRIEAEPSASAMISTVVPGLVREIYFTEGQKVSKGQALFELSGNEFIELQKDLAETASRHSRLRSEYERLKALYSDNIGSQKELILAESEYLACNAGYSALKMKVGLLELDAGRIEKGDFYGSFLVRAPIKGYVSDIYVSLGQYVDQHTAMTNVYDADRLHLKLAVFEKDVRHLKNGHKVKFNLSGDTLESYTATLHSVGRNVDEETKTVLCCAEIDDCCRTQFVHNTFVKAEVFTRVDSVFAVPEDAILNSEGNNYVLIPAKEEGNRHYLQRYPVNAGRSYNGFTEILDLPAGQKLVTSGAYSLNMEQ